MTAQGNQTIVVVTFAEDLAQVDRKLHPKRVPTLTKLANCCALQPVSVTETKKETDYAAVMWHALMPPVAAAISVSTDGQLYYDDTDPVTGVKALAGKAKRVTANDPVTGVPTDYALLEVIGSQVWYDDNSGLIDHVTAHVKSEVG
jgi:hypothetical protein